MSQQRRPSRIAAGARWAELLLLFFAKPLGLAETTAQRLVIASAGVWWAGFATFSFTRLRAAGVAVDDISFSCEKGEIVGLLGSNGAGKTTTMRMLTCYIPPTSGSARMAGHDVVRQSLDVRRRIGYLPESVPLYAEMRVREYLAYRGRLKGLPRTERGKALERALDLCGLVPMRRRILAQLSRGYRQRVGLADALLADPPLLVLDEPAPGTALLTAEGNGDHVGVSVWSYLYGPERARIVERDTPRIATSGALTIGVNAVPPIPPRLEIVKLPPCISAMVNLPSRARAPFSAIAFSISANDIASASRITGTTKPLGVPAAIPMWT